MNRTEMNAMSDNKLLELYKNHHCACYINNEGDRGIQGILCRQASEFKREIKRRMKSTDIQPSEDAINALERLHELSNNDELYRLYSILFDAVHGKGATR